MFKPDKVFVINLLRRPDRLAYFLNHCPLSDVDVVYAFDGKNPENEDLTKWNYSTPRSLRITKSNSLTKK